MGPKDARSASQRRLRALALLAGTLGVLALAFTLSFRVYRVDSGSMEPFLHGDAESGERVLVRYARRPELERFDTVVILLAGASDPVVKRVVGLPGESVQLVGGDLVIDGERLDVDAPRPAAVELFDSRRTPLDDAFQLAGPGWSRADDAWLLDARGSGPALESSAAWTGQLHDDHLDGQGRPVDGVTEIGDVVLELELAALAGAGRFEATLSEEADRFRLELRPDGERLELSLWRAHPTQGDSRLAAVEVARPAGTLRVRFANVDNHLTVELGGVRALAVGYAGNEPLRSESDRSYRHLRPRAAFGAVDLALRIERVRLARDLHWGERGSLGVAAPLRLGPDEIFVLGDNASHSRDSREHGPVPLEAVIGLPVAVVWPPSAWHRTGTARSPAG
jgi:signal peptidase I